MLPGAAIVAGCALVGSAAGRGIWEILSERSQRRVDVLAGELAEHARGLQAPVAPPASEVPSD